MKVALVCRKKTLKQNSLNVIIYSQGFRHEASLDALPGVVTMNRRSRHRLSEGPREAGPHHNNGARGYECVCAARKGRSARRRLTLPIGFPRRSSSLSCTIAICLCSCPFNSIWVSYLVFHSLPGSCRQTFARWLNAAECS